MLAVLLLCLIQMKRKWFFLANKLKELPKREQFIQQEPKWWWTAEQNSNKNKIYTAWQQKTWLSVRACVDQAKIKSFTSEKKKKT